MKCSFSYLPEEEGQALAAVKAVRAAVPVLVIRKSERHPPFKHIYLTTKKPRKPSDPKKNA